jgi:5-methylcytosine-specific restriction endonuclease McrA
MSTATLTNNHVLILNKNWTPLRTETLQKAISKVASTYADGTPKARVIDPDTFQTFTWDDWSKIQPEATEDYIATTRFSLKIPQIILLSRYEKTPRPKVHFNRRTLLKRDDHSCQYCGKRCAADEWSVDHVTPRAHGGQTTWENCVVACVKCNRRKADKTVQQAGMKLLKEPKKPDSNLMRFHSTKPVKSWSAFIGEAYHLVELVNDNQE